MKIKQKMNLIRKEILLNGVERKGEGEDYTFIRLEEILPSIIKLEADQDLFSHITTTVEFKEGKYIRKAILTISDLEQSEESLKWEMELIPSNQMRDPMQAMDSAQTYARRYLYMLAYNIVESDPIDLKNYEEKRAEVILKNNGNKPKQQDGEASKTKKPATSTKQTENNQVSKNNMKKPENKYPENAEEFMELGIYLCDGNAFTYSTILRSLGYNNASEISPDRFKAVTDKFYTIHKGRK